MHYFLYTIKDTFISNHQDCIDKNFGLDESLQIYSTHYYGNVTASLYTNNTQTGSFTGDVVSFTGYFTGSLCGTDTNISGTILSGC